MQMPNRSKMLTTVSSITRAEPNRYAISACLRAGLIETFECGDSGESNSSTMLEVS